MLLSTVTHFWLEWQVIISSILILSFFFASQADSQWYDTLRQALHPSIRSIVLLAVAATVASVEIQENTVDKMMVSAEREVEQLAEPTTRSAQNPALYMVRALIARVADSTTSPKVIKIKTHRFIDSVLAHHQDWDISLDITAKGSSLPLLKIQSRYDLTPSDSNGDYRVRQLTDVAISHAVLSDSILGSTQLQTKRTALVYSLSILKRRGLGFLPSGHLDDIGWKRTSLDSDIAIPSGIIDLDNRTLLSGKIPAKISYMLETPKSTLSAGITSKTIDDVSYLIVFRPVVVPDSSRQLAAATIALPTFKQSIDSAAPSILFLIFASALILLLILSWRWIHLQSFLSLQEKTLVTLFVIGIITSLVFANIIRKGISTESIRGFTQRLEQKKEFLYSERIITLRSDSVYIFTSHLHQAAAALNCDLALYDDKNTLKESTCRTCYDLSLLPVTLPSTIVQQLSIQSPRQFDGTTSILQQPVRYWATVLESPSVVKQHAYKLLLLQKDEAYPQFQQAVVARISSGVVGLLLLIIIIASYLSYRLVRPINQLRIAAQIIATNSLEISLPKKRRDEIGEMIESFDKMTFELSKGRERVAQSEREGAWKEMARQVAHEIKNPLTPMKLSIQHVQHAFEHQDTNFQNIFKRVVKTLTEQIDVLTRIATEFARFGEMPRRRYTFTSLPHIVDSALALFDAERSRIRFAVDIPKSLPAIYADEEEFRRTLVNLIKNAIQAIDKWGVILITASERSGLIHLQITDSGAGMKEETLKKAFDPNFSTKTSGMGLGLAIVKKTITDMSGTIRVESKPGEGTSFFIELPARGEQPTGHS
ncbi:MAG TPA: ATP-binding protein [Candidatus Kapabacteria bacterium]|nr:ATP-binding protein [Candidatus Kapabacteria bacterium]